MKLGIFLSMFPEPHETFILRELVALEREGVEFEIFSLQPPRDPITASEAQSLVDRKTHYGKLLGLSSLAAFAGAFVRSPISLLSIITSIIVHGWRRPMDLIKDLAVLPLSFKFAAEFERLGITALHSHWANVPMTACWALSRHTGLNWSAAIHGEDIFSKNHMLEYKLDKARFAVVCTDYFRTHLADNMGHSHPGNIHCNYHGLEPKLVERAQKFTFDYDREGCKNILSIGRLVPTKGHAELISALGQVTPDLDIRLKIVGSGPAEQELRALAEKVGVTDRVDFLGLLDHQQVMQAIEDADVFCLPSRFIPGHPPDGIPNVLAEAMVFGLPVISTKLGAIPELVDDGINGLLVTPGDVDEIGAALRRIFTDDTLRSSLGSEGRSKVMGLFDQSRNINELIEFFDRYHGATQ